MLTYLQTGRIYKISELASRLEMDTGESVNPRNIIEYRKELEYAGFPIVTVPGKFGGYRLDTNKIFPVIKLSDEEKAVLVDVYQYANSKQDFMNKDLFDKVFGKIMSSIKDNIEYDDFISIEQYQLTMNNPNLKKRYDFISKCIREKKQIEIEYASLKSGNKVYVLHPYKLFLYNNSWFFFAWNPNVGDVWYFKLNRILKFKQLDDKFIVWKYFNPRDYLDWRGFKNNGNWFEVEFIANGTRAMLMRERVYGKDQTIEELKNGSIKVSLMMQNEDAIVSFALSCGDEVKIIKPQWLIDKIINISNKNLEKYST